LRVRTSVVTAELRAATVRRALRRTGKAAEPQVIGHEALKAAEPQVIRHEALKAAEPHVVGHEALGSGGGP